jgi:hypothetical protein
MQLGSKENINFTELTLNYYTIKKYQTYLSFL